MSTSPVFHRRSSVSSVTSPTMDGLVNYYEAEEERIINLLSRKLEKLRVEKVNLENTLEAESEAHVNRLSRELTALRRQQQQQLQQNGTSSGGGVGTANGHLYTDSLIGHDPRFPTTDIMLEALRRENESLRTRLVDLERDYIRLRRLNEVYREELIEHRTEAGTSIENLIALDASVDDRPHFSHRRTPSSGSPNSAILTLPARGWQRATLSHAVPVPPPRVPSGGSPSTFHPFPRHHHHIDYSNIPSTSSSLTHSPISESSESPYTFSPVNGSLSNHRDPASYVSNNTTLTTPQSSISLQSNPPLPFPMQPPSLSYPSVPPPSLSSSLGSPVMTFPTASGTAAPDAFDLNANAPRPHRRNNSNSLTRRRGSSSARIAETGSLREISESRSRRESVERSNLGAPAQLVIGGPNPPSSYGGTSTSTSTSSSSRPIPIRLPTAGSREGTPVNGR